MDVIGAFLDECCSVGHEHRQNAKVLYERYAEWCAEGGERSSTRRKFDAQLTERGTFEVRRSGANGAREWHGLSLLTEKTTVFAGKLTQRSEKTHNSPGNTSTRANENSSVSSSVASVASVENPTQEQEERIRELVGRGFSEWAARTEVLAKDHPPGCECEVCL